MSSRIAALSVLCLLLLMNPGNALAAQDIGHPGTVQGILAALALAIGILGIRHGLKSDAVYRSQTVFHPVSVTKFVLMSVFTLNLYAFFWMYRHWCWLQSVEGKDVIPFARAFFSCFFLFAAFQSANKRLGNRMVPTWVGGTAAVGFLIYSTLYAFPAGTSKIIPMTVFALTPVAMLAFLPTLIAVNRLNDPSSAAYLANSRFNVWNIAGIALGLALFCYIGFVLFQSAG